MPSKDRYRWWPTYIPNRPEDTLLWDFLGECALLVVLCLPPITRVIGIRPLALILIIGGHIAFGYSGGWLLGRLKRTYPVAFHLQLGYELVTDSLTALLLIGCTGDPSTPLWLGFSLYAGLLGAMQELEPSWTFLIYLVAAPAITIPMFRYAGASMSSAVVYPIVGAAFCGLSYHLFAMRAAGGRRLRSEQELEIEKLRLHAAALERRQLAADLHDSVGSALSLVGMYSDLVERHSKEPTELVRIAGTLREATREGLGDLRGVLDAMAPDVGDLDAVVSNLRGVAGRVMAASSTSVAIAVEGEGAAELNGRLRLAIIRLFQEALHNAVRHGRCSTIDVTVALDAATFRLDIRDDGCGFDASSAPPGRGLPSMRARTVELGGTLSIESAAGRGTHLSVVLPR